MTSSPTKQIVQMKILYSKNHDVISILYIFSRTKIKVKKNTITKEKYFQVFKFRRWLFSQNIHRIEPQKNKIKCYF